MKRMIMMMACMLSLTVFASKVETAATASDIVLEAEIQNGILSGTLSFMLNDLDPENPFPALANNVAIVSESLPKGMKLLPSDLTEKYQIAAEKSFWGGRKSGRVVLKFTTPETTLAKLGIPMAPVRKFVVKYNPSEYEVEVENAGSLEKTEPEAGAVKATLSGNLPLSDWISIAWVPAATRFLHSDSVLSCKAETTSLVSPGVIQHTSRFVFKITQGTVRSYSFLVPKHVNIVNTETDFGLLKQTLEDSDNAAYSKLTLTSQTESKGAVIQLVYEDALPAFPCQAILEPISPVGVLRTDGLLFVAPRGSVRLLPGALRNLLQTDATAIPLATEAVAKSGVRVGSGSCYRYTTTPCTLELGLEDIVTAIHAENTVVLDVEDSLASIEAILQLDLRDAPADKIAVLVGKFAGWTITAIAGKGVADGDVEQRDKGKGDLELVIPFERQVMGILCVSIKMEKKIDTASPGKIEIPEISVKDAIVQNGFIVVAASQGIQLASEKNENLSEIHAASTPINKVGAQLAFRFRGETWAASIGFTRAKTSVHSELFHLVSPGDGILYASVVASFHVSGAPADTFTFHVPAQLKQVEVTCAEMDSWSREGEVLTVKMARRIMGDWTMLISYEQQLDYHGGELAVGEISTSATESEMGFIVLAGPASLKAEEAEALPEAMIRIGKEEIPVGYSATLLSPVTAAWKYMRAPHVAKIRLTPLATEGIIAQVVDFLTIETKVTRGGASVTKARYSVKNASGQYLTLELPEGAKLWEINKLDENGNKISEIPSQFHDGILLIPVERPRDPNSATTVEIHYAVDNSASPKHQSLQAPRSTTAPITFAEWTLVADDNLAVRHVVGTLSRDENSKLTRFTRTSIMPDDQPLALRFNVVSQWLAGVNIVTVVVLALLALAALIGFIYSQKLIALAIVVSSVFALGYQFDWGVMMAVPVLVLILLVYGTLRRIAKAFAGRISKQQETVGEVEPPPFITVDSLDSTHEGSTRFGMSLALVILSGAALALPIKLDYTGELSGRDRPTVWRADMKIVVVPPEKDSPDVVKMLITHEIDCTLHEAGAYAYPSQVVEVEQGKFVMLESEIPDGLKLVYGSLVMSGDVIDSVTTDPAETTDGELFFVASRPGRYKIKFTISQIGSLSGVKIKTFSAIKSAVSIHVPSSGLEASVENLYGRSRIVDAEGGSLLTGYMAEGETSIDVQITPKQRDVEAESLVMSADVSTYASIRSGVVDVMTSVGYRVLQGVVKKVRIGIPESLHVVDLGGDVAEWSFDSATRILSVAVKAPLSGEFVVSVRCNAVAKNFPYECKLAVPDVMDVTRQNGELGVSAADSVLLNLIDSAGCNPIRNEDFRRGVNSWQSTPEMKAEKIRRAFRYDNASKVAVTMSADAVKPELRSALTIAMSVGDERNTLNAQLGLTVAKAGVFSVNLEIPTGYVIETLTGEKVVSWDDRRKTNGGVDVMFGSSFEGETQLYVVLSKQQRGVDAEINVPRISVGGAVRQTGRVTITAERGVKLTLDQHDGVVSSKSDEGFGVAKKNAVLLDILRTDWSASLKTQVLDPVVKPELLQSISIAEGMLQHRIYLRCKIENAGVKQFRVVVPVKGASLTVSGRNISRVVPEGEADSDDGSQVWLIELQGKVDNEYSATYFYQEQVDPAEPVTVKPMRVVGAQRQTGWVVVFGESRIKVDAQISAAGLRAEDARTIPDIFGAGDLSAALGCWKVLDAETSLALSVTRHLSAEVLPAAVENVRQTTVLSLGGRTLAQTSVKLSVGRLRFLRIKLPRETSDLWTAQVNGVSVAVSKEEGGVLCVPLDLVTEGEKAEVSFVWADNPDKGLSGKVVLESPRFPDLPLRDIQWTLYAPEEYTYTLKNEDFDETDGRGSKQYYLGSSFDRGRYQSRNKEISQGVLVQAKSSFAQVGKMLESGERGKAQRALKQAIDLSQADASLNEDARVQFENVAVQNTKIGFMNRRDALRASNNIFEEGVQQQSAIGFNDGNFSQEFAQQLEGRLSARDRMALELVSSKIVGQQAAVVEAAQAISVTMPENGPSLVFTRALQTQPGGSMVLELRISRGIKNVMKASWARPYVQLACAIPVAWVLLVFAFGSRRRGRNSRRAG